MTAARLQGRSILYLVTEDWYFWSHRLNLARAAQAAGARVIVAASMSDYATRIADEGFLPVHIPFDRSGFNPFKDVSTLLKILKTYRKFSPDLVHHVAAKPVFYGTIAARLARTPAILNAMAGMGFLYMDKSPRTWLARHAFQIGLRSGLRQRTTLVTVQNADDFAALRGFGIPEQQIVTIPGSGVDLEAYPVREAPPAPPVVAVFAARMLWSKGIKELVEAARILAARGVPIRVRLLGSTDANPSRVPSDTMLAWREEGVLEVVGHSNDVAGEFARAHIAVLPSYREGLPKALLEAASCGRPIVATDVPGCREICRDGETGILVPACDPLRLADALEELAGDAEMRMRMGTRAREVVEAEYASQRIADLTLGAYQRLLDEANRHG
ncbi:glycosyltransferase family 4 protein [Salinarimonas sp.]|uniref:glycosyltransferase family 4 protein n=1 Tax=Salinarimonas sp. TaxID=2766526 RepID=UPI0032D8E465